MNSGTFTIKVSDILLHSGSDDTILFTNIFSTKLPGLLKEGITGKLLLKNLNKSEILIITKNIYAQISSSCDRCGLDFIEKRCVDGVAIQAKILEKPLITEDILLIESKALTVNVEDFLVDQFLLHQPIKCLCKTCEEIEIDDDIEIDYVRTGVIRH